MGVFIPGGSEKVEGRFSLPTKNLFQYSWFRGQGRKLHIPYLGKWQLPPSPEDVFFPRLRNVATRTLIPIAQVYLKRGHFRQSMQR